MANNEKQKSEITSNIKVNNKRKIVNTICIIVLSVCVIISTVGFVLVQNILSSAKINEGINSLTSKSSSVIYDNEGNIFSTLSGESGIRENIKYSEIPQVVIDAFVSVEDSRYFKHGGFDLPRFIKSGMNNITSGSIKEGGSTLTMQLVDVKLYSEEEKATFNTVQKLEQKVVEIFKSMEIESKIDKEKIIELYLNGINFGGQARGIQKGSQYYFGKDAKNLTLTEAAFLAGVINAPGAYNPYGVMASEDANNTHSVYYQRATKRRDEVLYYMNLHGFISDNEYKLAKTTDLSFQLNGTKNFDTAQYQAFVDKVVEETIEKTGKNPYTTPMKIYTTMNREAQELCDAMLNGDGIDYPDELIQTGFTAIDNQTGEILAIGGGRGYGGETRNNRGYSARKQIGSTAKPVVDYAPAFDILGYSTEHVFADVPTEYGEGKTMYNADRRYHGDVTFKEAVGHSYNIPAYTTLRELTNTIGVDGVVKLFNKMGFTSVTKENFALGMSIGGSDLTATPLELAAAFGALANEGNKIDSYSIKKIDFEDEDIATYETEIKETSVYSDEAAYLTSYILKDTVEGGYGTLVDSLRSNYPVYGKSGTTDFGEEAAQWNIPVGASKEKWMVGYTNQYTVSCWVGYDEFIEGQNTWMDDSKLYLNIEGRVVKRLLDKLTGGVAEEIKRPAGVVNITHIQGLFPYASAGAGGNMVTGLIRKKFSNISASVTPDAVSSIDSFDATLTNNVVTLTHAAYPNASALTPKGASKTVSVGGETLTYVPKFSKNLLFGPIQYKYEISVNGVVVATSGSSNASTKVTINSNNDDNVKVCGFYGYANNDTNSNKICKDLVSKVSNSYKIGTDFTALFNNTTYEDSEAAVMNWVNTTLPGVTVTFDKDETVAIGKYSPKSTIKAGDTVKSGETYLIVIGTKQ